MRKKILILAIGWCLLIAGVLLADFQYGGCPTCTDGFINVIRGDTSHTGTLTTGKGITITTGNLTLASGVISAVGGEQGTTTKALTAGSATSFALVTVPANSFVAGHVYYTINADDGTDFQGRSGVLFFVAVNKAGTLTCTPFRAQGSTTVDNTTDGAAVSSGTITNTFTCVTSTNSVLLKANAASSLTETTLNLNWRPAIDSGTATVISQ